MSGNRGGETIVQMVQELRAGGYCLCSRRKFSKFSMFVLKYMFIKVEVSIENLTDLRWNNVRELF